MRPSVILRILACLALPSPALAQEGAIVMPPSTIPNHAGGGIGFAPDYIGSDDYSLGGLPVARISSGQRYLQLLGNSLYANLLDSSRVGFGLVGTYRFGRDHVDDAVVQHLADVADTINLGLFVDAELLGLNDPRRRWWAGLSGQHDILGEHQGYTLDLTTRLWWPVADWLQMGVFGAVTYGSRDYMSTVFDVSAEGAARSGLPAFQADAGFRDARITLSFITELAPSWFIGTGLMYQRLLGDAADSPTVEERGSKNQVYGGIGLIYTW